MDNEREIARWNHPRWVASWPAREALTSRVTPLLLDALRAPRGTRILDVGCGGGGLTLAVAERAGAKGRVVGVDVSAALLTLAGERAASAGLADRIDFVQADMQSGTVPGLPFDAVTSQFGVMFFDEPVVAFANLGRHLAPEGQLVFACWQPLSENPWHVSTVLAPFVPPPAVPRQGKSAHGPFTLGDPERTSALLAQAGFAVVEVVAHRDAVVAPASAVVDRALLEFMGVGPSDLVQAEAAVEHHLASFAVGDGAYEFPLAFHVVTAGLR